MTVRASELATYTFCERAWHYARLGAPHELRDQMERGERWHARLEGRTRRSITLMRTGVILLVSGAALTILASLAG